MVNEDKTVKALMMILLGVGLVFFNQMIQKPLEVTMSQNNNVNDEFFLFLLDWGTLIGAIPLLIIGILQIISLVIKRK